MFHGMDVEQMRDHAQRIRAAQRRLEESRRLLDSRIRALGAHWVGPDAEEFRQSWESGPDAAWRTLLDQLEQRATSAEQEADAQDSASQADGAGARDSTGDSAAGAGLPPGASGTGMSPLGLRDEDSPDDLTIDPAVAGAWKNTEYTDRGKIMYELVKQEFAQYGLAPPRMAWFQADTRRTVDVIDKGRWDQGNYTVYFNEWALHDPSMLLTVAHEARHAAQHAAVTPSAKDFSVIPLPGSMAVTRLLLMAQHDVEVTEFAGWWENLQAYRTSEEIGFEAYQAQPVEQDARRASADYNEELTLQELQDLQARAGVPITEP